MALREIIKKGDPVLEKHCHPVTRFDQKLWDLLDDMRETLAQANGLGLAAPQVGISKRVIVVCDGDGETMEFINPVLLSAKGMVEEAEGCLSVPGVQCMVPRAEKIKIKAQDRNGQSFELKAEGYLARVIQHEMDHLDGRLFIDIMTEEI